MEGCMKYKEIESKVLQILEKTLFCTLATANKNGIVSTAQMSLINDGLTVYLQTDKTFEKIENIKENPNVAINCGAYNFKGIAKIIGHPCDNTQFIENIKKKHLSTFNHYTNLKNEVLIEIELTQCKIWGVDSSKEIHNQETILVINFKDKQIETIVCDKM